jgi:hypothetical protein
MKVIDHVPDAWTLFRQGQELFLDAHCQRGAFGFSVLLRLDAEETYAYRVDGHAFAEALARAIAVSMAGGGESPYRSRDVAPLYSDRVAVALEAWHARPTPESGPGAVLDEADEADGESAPL